jgi:DNA repair protein RecO (recombination protein O)
MVMDSYLLRAVATGRVRPQPDACASCGEVGPHEAFSPAAGGLVCRRCRPPGTPQVRPATLALSVGADQRGLAGHARADEATQRQASGLIAAFVAGTWSGACAR